MRARHQRRAGAAIVEVAISVPILMAMFFAALSFSRVHSIRNSISLAAYEGARHGILPGKTADDVEDVIQRSIGTVGIAKAKVTVSPKKITDKTPRVTVSISVPMKENLFLFSSLFSDRRVDATCTLTRETAMTDSNDD